MIPKIKIVQVKISYLPADSVVGKAANYLLEQWAIQEVNRAVNRWLYENGALANGMPNSPASRCAPIP